MARFTGGWIKIDRQLFNGDIGQRASILAVFVTLLGWASRFETKINFGGVPKIIPPGSVVFGIRELAEHLDLSKDTVYRSLKYLKNRDTICITSATTGTIVTICNWDKYQNNSNEDATPVRQLLIHGRDTGATRAGHGPTLNGEEENKRIKERKKKTLVGIRTDYPPEFDSMWIKYGKRGDKKQAFEEWQKLKLTEIERAMLGRSIDQYIQNNEPKFRKHLCRYLKTDWREVETEVGKSPEGNKLDWDFLESSDGRKREASNG